MKKLTTTKKKNTKQHHTKLIHLQICVVQFPLTPFLTPKSLKFNLPVGTVAFFLYVEDSV